MGEKISTILEFWKSKWGTHYFIWFIIFLLFVVYITFFQILISNNYVRMILIGALIFYFVFGHFFAIYTFNFVKGLYTKIITLNNFSYKDKTLEWKIPSLIIVLPVYLIIFQIYFITIGYNFIESLIFGWLVLIFVRSSHYVDFNIGSNIGKIIGSFFIPFGFIILLIKGTSFYIDISVNNAFNEEHIAYLIYFIVFILATIPLEIILDYKGENKRREDQIIEKKREWKKNPCFVKYIKK